MKPWRQSPALCKLVVTVLHPEVDAEGEMMKPPQQREELQTSWSSVRLRNKNTQVEVLASKVRSLGMFEERPGQMTNRKSVCQCLSFPSLE